MRAQRTEFQPEPCIFVRLPWQPAAGTAGLGFMDTVNPTPNDRADAPRPDTEAESQRRLTWEAEMIAEADAEIEAGLYVDADEVDAWIDTIGSDHELPPPPTRRR
jgi:hypothetical protein